MAPMQVSMRASAATLAVLGLLAASFAGGASGAGSPNVAALQVGLRTHGLYQGTVDGVLGPRTERAVMRFQRRAGLSPDGVIGKRTRKAFGQYGRRGPLGRRDLAIGTRGWDVAALQFALATCTGRAAIASMRASTSRPPRGRPWAPPLPGASSSQQWAKGSASSSCSSMHTASGPGTRTCRGSLFAWASM